MAPDFSNLDPRKEIPTGQAQAGPGGKPEPLSFGGSAPRSLTGTVGDFLAPQLTQTLRDARDPNKDVTGRQIAGSALEVGSYLLPVGWAVRGVNAAIRGGRALTGLKAATTKTPELAKATEILSGSRQLAGKAIKEGAAVGGVSGAMFGAGQGIAEGDSIGDIAKEAAIGGAAGTVGGAVISPVVVLAGMSAAGVTRATSKSIRDAKSAINPTDRAQAIEDLTESITQAVPTKSFTNKLEELGQKASSRTNQMTGRDRLREMLDEGYLPDIVDDRFSVRGIQDDAWARIRNLSEAVGELAKRSTAKVNIDDFKTSVMRSIEEDPYIDITAAENQMNRLFEGWRKKYGSEISMDAVNEIRKAMNQKTRAFNKPDYIADTADLIARQSRNYLDEFVPEAKDLNRESARLHRVRETAELLKGETVQVGFLTSGIGRFLGVLGGASAGLSVAGPGGLVVAGLMAQFGSKTFATIIRQARFNDNMRKILQEGVRTDEALINKLIKEAKGPDKTIIKQFKEEAFAAPVERTVNPSRPPRALDNNMPTLDADTMSAPNVSARALSATTPNNPVARVSPAMIVNDEVANAAYKEIAAVLDTPPQLSSIEVFTDPVESPLRTQQYGILTAENPNAQALTPQENFARNQELYNDLIARGYKPYPVEGHYGGNPEHSWIVFGMPTDEAAEIGIKYQQESVLTPEGLVYQDMTVNPADLSNINFNSNQDSFYSQVTINGENVKFSVPVDFETKVPLSNVSNNPALRTGQQNTEFFTGKAAEASSPITYAPTIDVPQVEPTVKKAFDTFTMGGNFTGHISKMIPAFAEKQLATTQAIIKSNAKNFLDIGASEGGVVKTVSSINPNIRGVALDPNVQMQENFNKTPAVQNAEFRLEALGASWTEADGTVINQFTPTEKFDVINEDFAFQFINNDRAGQVKMVKEMMTDDGIFISSEKFHTKNKDANEIKKYDHQRKYFTKDQLTEDKQSIVTGMADDMVSDTEYEKVLKDNFKYVAEYWNSGNFKGYLASDSKAQMRVFLRNIGNVNSEFSENLTPRVVKGDKDLTKNLGFEKTRMTTNNDLSFLDEGPDVLRESVTPAQLESFDIGSMKVPNVARSSEEVRASKEFKNFERDPSLTPEDSAIQEAAIEKFLSNPQKMVDDYIEANGPIVNTDEARKLFDGYRGINAPAVHEPSSAVAKAVFEHLLANNPGKTVAIYAGGGGSGKTSVISSMFADQLGDVNSVFDGTLAKYSSAEKLIKQSQAAGKTPHIFYVFRDPTEAWVNGVIKRTLNNPEEGGRIVRMSDYIAAHLGAMDTMKKLVKSDFDIDISMADNSLGAGNQMPLSVEKLENLRYNKDELRSILEAQTKQLYDEGTITKEQYDSLIK